MGGGSARVDLFDGVLSSSFRGCSLIILFDGVPGSGKTYDAVAKILDNLKMGRRVYTNIEGMDDPVCQETIKASLDLSDSEFKERFVWLPEEKMKVFWEIVEHGSLIVVDEVHLLWDNRSWSTESNRQFTRWCSTHRHYGFDLVLLTQSLEKLDSHVRSSLQ